MGQFAKNGWCSVKPLDDPQLRAKLIKASNDMPHVDMWAKIQAEAGDISQAAQARTTRARFSIFSGLQLLAPAFVILLVFGATLLSLTDELTGQTFPMTSGPTAGSATVVLPTSSTQVSSRDDATHPSSAAYDRLMARNVAPAEEMLSRQSGAGGAVDNTAAPEPSTPPLVRAENRDDTRAEWREYMEQKQPHGRSDTLHLIRPFLSTQTPQ